MEILDLGIMEILDVGGMPMLPVVPRDDVIELTIYASQFRHLRALISIPARHSLFLPTPTTSTRHRLPNLTVPTISVNSSCIDRRLSQRARPHLRSPRRVFMVAHHSQPNVSSNPSDVPAQPQYPVSQRSPQGREGRLITLVLEVKTERAINHTRMKTD